MLGTFGPMDPYADLWTLGPLDAYSNLRDPPEKLLDIRAGRCFNQLMRNKNHHNLQSLVAMNYSGDGNIERVISFVDKFGALVWVETVQVQHFRDAERFIETHRVTFDANKVRNTEVHAAGFGAGFVVHIE